jgi:hypothetical protein
MSPMYLEGAKEVTQNVLNLLEHLSEQTAEGVRDALIDIGTRAADKAPVRDGYLRGSMTTDVIIYDGELIGEVRFNEKYAAVQHERTEFKHPKGGEAKYLERAAIEKREQVREKVGEALNELFGGA